MDACVGERGERQVVSETFVREKRSPRSQAIVVADVNIQVRSRHSPATRDDVFPASRRDGIAGARARTAPHGVLVVIAKMAF